MWLYALSSKAEGSVSFDARELERLEDARLVLLGVAPSELKHMSIELRADVLSMYNAIEHLKNGQMPK